MWPRCANKPSISRVGVANDPAKTVPVSSTNYPGRPGPGRRVVVGRGSPSRSTRGGEGFSKAMTDIGPSPSW